MKEKRIVVATVLLVNMIFSVEVMQAQHVDTASVNRDYSLDEVVVTGSREETDIRHLSQTVTVVDRLKIEKALQPSLLPVLTEQVPGLFVT